VKVYLKSKAYFRVKNLQSITDKDGKDISKDFIGYSQLTFFKGTFEEGIVNGSDIEYVIFDESR